MATTAVMNDIFYLIPTCCRLTSSSSNWWRWRHRIITCFCHLHYSATIDISSVTVNKHWPMCYHIILLATNTQCTGYTTSYLLELYRVDWTDWQMGRMLEWHRIQAKDTVDSLRLFQSKHLPTYLNQVESWYCTYGCLLVASVACVHPAFLFPTDLFILPEKRILRRHSSVVIGFKNILDSHSPTVLKSRLFCPVY